MMNYHDCEFERIDERTFRYYYTEKLHHTAGVIIHNDSPDNWYYERLGNMSRSVCFSSLQECLDAAYEDMVRSKL